MLVKIGQNPDKLIKTMKMFINLNLGLIRYFRPKIRILRETATYRRSNSEDYRSESRSKLLKFDGIWGSNPTVNEKNGKQLSEM